MQRGKEIVCPFCDCVLKSHFKAQKHVGHSLLSSRCPEKAEWLRRVPCPGGAPPCRVPVRLLTSEYHKPAHCLKEYSDWESLRDTFPDIRPFRSIWKSGRLSPLRPELPSVIPRPTTLPLSSFIKAEEANDG